MFDAVPAETQVWPGSPCQPGTQSSRKAARARSTTLEGSPVDIERSVALWGDAVMRLALCKARNQADAEDITQMVFLKLCERKLPFESDEHLKAWLLRVTLTCTVDVKGDPWFSRLIKRGGDGAQALESLVSDREQTTFASPEATLIEVVVADAVATLSEKQRIAVHLYYFEDMSIEKIALVMDEKPSTVRSHLHRARAALKQVIGDPHE